MKIGDKIYRVTRNKYDGKWYFCVYELISITRNVALGCGFITAAPILTYYDSNYKSRSTFPFKQYSETMDEWVRDWDYITSVEHLAVSVYKEKIKNENNTENEIKSRSNH